MTSRDQSSTFLHALSEGLKQCDFADGRILVGVSGGADSVALLRGLAFLSTGDPDPRRATNVRFEIVVAHVDHQLRDNSADDAKWVRNLADEFGIPCRVETANVSERIAETHESVEEAARKARYDLLAKIAREEDCSAIAVAHTADDQAETVLHHLVRGTSVTGLRGMQWSRPLLSSREETSAENIRLIRPMLGIRRAELEAWLSAISQDYRTDPTNSDNALTRNRIRRELLPLLEQDFNPQIRKALSTLAGHAAEVSDLLSGLTRQLVEDSLVQASGSSIRISCPALENQPTILIRETLLTIWRQAAWPLKRMGHREWQKLSELVSGNSTGAVSLPEKIDARRRGQLLILSRKQALPESEAS